MNLLGRSLKPLITRAFGKQGPAFAQLLTDWHAIAGELAERAVPKDIRFDRVGGGDSQNGRLILSCNSADAPELQMQIPLLLERIRRHMGYSLIGTIMLEHK